MYISKKHLVLELLNLVFGRYIVITVAFGLCVTILISGPLGSYCAQQAEAKYQKAPPVFTALQAVDVCVARVPLEFPDPDKVTIAGTPTARLADGTWLVVGLVDAPLDSRVLQRKEWACGLSQDGNVQFINVRSEP